MRDTYDVLIVTFDRGLNNDSALCVGRKDGDILKIEVEEQADILYRLLTEQMTKAEIKAESEGQGMSKTIQRPLACRNAHCGAMCSPADASMLGGNPSKCFMYERRDDLYRKNKLLDEIRAEIDNALSDGMIHKKTVLGIIDKYQKESEELADGKA